jgi:hypothetical protein
LVGFGRKKTKEGEEGIFVSTAARWEEGAYIGFAALGVGRGGCDAVWVVVSQ